MPGQTDSTLVSIIMLSALYNVEKISGLFLARKYPLCCPKLILLKASTTKLDKYPILPQVI